MSRTTTIFSPGPWSVCEGASTAHVCDCGLVWDATESCVIATVNGPMYLDGHEVDCAPDKETQVANARLIAAAPDLYEACREVAVDMRRHVESLRASTGCPDLTPKQCAWATHLERAIAKAEGPQTGSGQ